MSKCFFLLLQLSYLKFPKYSDTQKICCNHSKILTMWLYHRVMSPNDADRMANSVDPDHNCSSDLGLHCLPRHICPKTWDHYGIWLSSECVMDIQAIFFRLIP